MADPKVLKTRNKAHTLGPTEIYTSLLIVTGQCTVNSLTVLYIQIIAPMLTRTLPVNIYIWLSALRLPSCVRQLKHLHVGSAEKGQYPRDNKVCT